MKRHQGAPAAQLDREHRELRNVVERLIILSGRRSCQGDVESYVLPNIIKRVFSKTFGVNLWEPIIQLNLPNQKKTPGMSSHQLLVLVLIQVIILLLPSFGLAKLFEKRPYSRLKAYIPFYNTYVMLQKLAERPKQRGILAAHPGCRLFISLGIYVEFVKTFGSSSCRRCHGGLCAADLFPDDRV